MTEFCNRTRREFLWETGAGFTGLALTGMLSLDGFFVPMADEYQSEYAPASAQRIAFLSGFTGSAGFIIILCDKAAF